VPLLGRLMQRGVTILFKTNAQLEVVRSSCRESSRPHMKQQHASSNLKFTLCKNLQELNLYSLTTQKGENVNQSFYSYTTDIFL